MSPSFFFFAAVSSMFMIVHYLYFILIRFLRESQLAAVEYVRIETSKILAEREEFLLKYSKVRMIAEP